MKTENRKPTQLIERRSEYERGANIATQIDVHKCFCGLGEIEHRRVPGFDDDYFAIKCPICNLKYCFIGNMGYDWEVHLN